MTSSIKVFVGCAANGEDAESQAVLEYTLRKHSSRPVELHWMRLSREIGSVFQGWDTSRWHTPFSGFRWLVPHLCSFQGKAIYTDSDVIWMADVAELWDQPIPKGRIVLSKKSGGKKLNTLLWDCSAAMHRMPALWVMKLPDTNRTMTHFLRDNPNLVGQWSGDWDCIDGGKYDDLSEAKLIHYSYMPNQPHLDQAKERLAKFGLTHWYDGPTAPHWRTDLIELFHQLLEEAVKEYPLDSYMPEKLYGPYQKRSQRYRRPK